jgi:hypothetical protein
LWQLSVERNKDRYLLDFQKVTFQTDAAPLKKAVGARGYPLHPTEGETVWKHAT